MWTNNELRKKDWCKGIRTHEQDVGQRLVSAPKFVVDLLLMPEWALPRMKEKLSDKVPPVARVPNGRVVLLNNMKAPLDEPAEKVLVFGSLAKETLK